MRCENCGKNEANFIYRSSINGRTEEHHLCQACAEKLGYTRNFFDQRPSLMDSLFGNSGFFDSMPSLMGRWRAHLTISSTRCLPSERVRCGRSRWRRKRT